MSARPRVLSATTRRAKQLDWPAVIKDQLATEKPNVIVVMLGLNDRVADPRWRAGQGRRADQSREVRAGEGGARKAAQEKAAQGKEEKAPAPARRPLPPQPHRHQAVADSTAQHPVPGRSYDFHTDPWADLYVKRIDEMIAALKSKGVPVLWVGLPALRGPKSTSDMAYLDELYRERAERAGIYYVDIWDGFVDDQGRYAVDGPDFEGQIRRLRTTDGVHFTKAGAVKLASYVDLELRRVMSNRTAPVALPEQASPMKPGTPAGLTSARYCRSQSQQRRGFGRRRRSSRRRQPIRRLSRPIRLQPRYWIAGDPIAAVAGRADDFSWPRPQAPADAAPQPVSLAPAAPAKKGPPRTKRRKSRPKPRRM